MQKLAGIDSAGPATIERGQKIRQSASQKPSISKIHTSAPVHEGDLKRYAAMKTTSKDQRNQNIADAFYQGGHSQTAIALAFGVSTSTVSRVVA